jgi:phosphate transport system substrate-binding protein
MKKFYAVLFVMGFLFSANLARAEVAINGAGATFPYPVYAQWGYKYNQLTGAKINYQSIGSGGGIAQIKAKTVDFGASDAPLTASELDLAGLVQFPMVIGGVVPVINLPGVTPGQLKLSGAVLADLFLGKIKNWNDPILQKLNPDVKLPDKAVTVVHRADGSGTTWIFTTYLAQTSPEWKEKVGVEKAVAWPTGVGGKGNEGVAAYVQRIAGAIGYVEYAYAVQNKMNVTLLQNQAGQFVAPTAESFQAAALNADWASTPGYAVVLTNQAGEKSWPITGASFILLQKNQTDAVKAKEMLKFFDWAFKNGDQIAESLHYVTVPDNVVTLLQGKWAELIKSNAQASVWP